MIRKISHRDAKLSGEVEILLYDLLVAVRKANLAGIGTKIDFCKDQTSLTMWRAESTAVFDEARAKIIKKISIP